MNEMNAMRLKMKDTFERLCSLCSLHVYFPTAFGAQTLLDPLSTALHVLQLVGKIRFSSWSFIQDLCFSLQIQAFPKAQHIDHQHQEIVWNLHRDDGLGKH